MADHHIKSVSYQYDVVRWFAVATVIWGIVGMGLGVYLASELVWPALNLNTPWLTFGRLRPLHTNVVIFGFGGSALFATAYYVAQRTCYAKLAFPNVARFTFAAWQTVIIAAVITLPMGFTSTKEYAELEWPIDILILITWVCFALVFFKTIANRQTSHIYVANWFYGAFILVIALIHTVNNLAIPLAPFKSYSVFAGAIDAMVQWWWAHNSVGFFLTAGFLGMMYYFVPVQAQRPIYSYRLSIIHFWALTALYMWAGSHHLHYSALPNWTQTTGMVFSLILLAPSWGGMINGVMTLSGAWDKLRTDPIIRFLIVALSFYGMSTFEGPMMAIKTVNALSHNTDWTIGHVHSGALGWVAMMAIGSLYVLIPRVFSNSTEMHSKQLIFTHFWLCVIGTLIYIISMWFSGISSGLMQAAMNDDGTLRYAFVEVVTNRINFHIMRIFGGLFFLSGMFVMAYNVFMTISAAKSEIPADEFVKA